MISFPEVVNFDPEQIRDIFSTCSARQQNCTDLSTHVKKLSDLHTWEGDAAKAAKDSAAKTHGDIAAHGQEAWKIAAAARDCYDEGVASRSAARQVQADADKRGFVIDPVSSKVTDSEPLNMRGMAEEDKQAYYDEIKAFQVRVDKVITDAERFDDDLAAAINAADGSIPLTPVGEGGNVNLADRRANQVAAFRTLYKRDPSTENDWRMAEALDPHTYDPKTKGPRAEIVAGTFPPQPGRGVVRINSFIPREKVFNVGADDLGDNRGFNAEARAEDSRASFCIDYDKGIVVARQNPSVSTSGEVGAGRPEVTVSEGADGQLNIKNMMANPLAPPGSQLIGESTRGAIAIPGGNSVPSLNGTMTNYPAAEAYRYPDGAGPTQSIFQYNPGASTTIAGDSQVGPLINLPFTRSIGDPDLFPHHDGARLSVDPYSSRPPDRVFLEGTPLAAPSTPAQIGQAPH